MTKTFNAITERRRAYKAGSVITSTVPAIPGTVILGAMTNVSGTIRRVAITTFPPTANSLSVELSLNGGAYAVSSIVPLLGATSFDIDTGSATAYSVRARGVNSGGVSASYSNVVSGSIAVPVPPTVTASRINDTTIRFAFSGGSGAVSWVGYYRTPAGFGTYSLVSLTLGQAYYDLTVTSGNTANFYVAATNSTGAVVNSNTATGSAASGSDSFGRVFFDDFSSGSLNPAWTQDSYRNMPTVVSVAADGGSPLTGNYMMSSNINGTVAWNSAEAYQAAVLPSWSYVREFLLRIYVRYDADVSYHAINRKLMRMGYGQPTDLIIETWDNMHVDVIEGNGIEGYPSNADLDDHQWHKIEIYCRENDPGLANGVFKFWLDDVLDSGLNISNLNQSTANSSWYPLNWISNWSNYSHDANNHVYMDRIEIFSDTATGGTGSMADGTAGVA